MKKTLEIPKGWAAISCGNCIRAEEEGDHLCTCVRGEELLNAHLPLSSEAAALGNQTNKV